jgi:4-hydroxy-3-polyprenylbenzoate decarboxylase
MKHIVVGVSGASGVILALKVIKVLVERGYFIDLILTKAALMTAALEMGQEFGTKKGFLNSLKPQYLSFIELHELNNFGASIASGSFKTEGMLLIPCSMATLAAVAMGLSDNLLRRAADVVLKERRPLVIVPRESPLSVIHLKHMLSLTEAGAIIVPPVPAWYNHPASLDDVENFIVGKALDALAIDHDLYTRWKSI